jgi:7-cyano-7-deazaguanine synthase
LGAVQHKTIKLGIGELGHSALTDHSLTVPDYTGSLEIPITYVPARNTQFLAVALAWAEILEAYDIFIGVSSIDYSHYPDCRPAYIEAFQEMARLATKASVEGETCNIHAPLLYLSKADTIKAGLNLGVDYAMTVSCYSADNQGRACGRCDACSFRKKGFAEAGIVDPTRYI